MQRKCTHFCRNIVHNMGDLPFVYLSVCQYVPLQAWGSASQDQPARPEDQSARPEAKPARPEAKPSRPKAQTARPKANPDLRQR